MKRKTSIHSSKLKETLYSGFSSLFFFFTTDTLDSVKFPHKPRRCMSTLKGRGLCAQRVKHDNVDHPPKLNP